MLSRLPSYVTGLFLFEPLFVYFGADLCFWLISTIWQYQLEWHSVEHSYLQGPTVPFNSIKPNQPWYLSESSNLSFTLMVGEGHYPCLLKIQFFIWTWIRLYLIIDASHLNTPFLFLFCFFFVFYSNSSLNVFLACGFELHHILYNIVIFWCLI